MNVIFPSLLVAASPFEGRFFLFLIDRSDLVAWGVLGVLIVFSVLSWGVYLDKLWYLSRVRRNTRRFVETFRAGEDLEEVFYAALKLKPSPINRIFQSGYKAYRRFIGQDLTRPRGATREDVLRTVATAMSGVLAEESIQIERRIPFLGTTASATPFVGLFGTVFGILKAFFDISKGGSSRIDVVAPGIAEALWATAAGLVVAIPAVLFFNSLSTRVRAQVVELERYSGEFLSIMQRTLEIEEPH